MLCAPTPIWRPLFKLTRSSLADPSPICSFLKKLDLFHPLSKENVILKVFGTFFSLPKMTSLSLEGKRLLGRAANTSDVIAKQSVTGPTSSLGTRLTSSECFRSLLNFLIIFFLFVCLFVQAINMKSKRNENCDPYLQPCAAVAEECEISVCDGHPLKCYPDPQTGTCGKEYSSSFRR